MNIFDFVNERSVMASRQKDYVTAFPFPYCVIDDFLRPEIADKIATAFPNEESDIWWKYENILEKKQASDDIRKFSPEIAPCIHALQHQQFIGLLENITGIDGLQSDPYLHGGGLHLIKSGGKLDMHVDYSIHPKLGLERRVNLILYLVSKNWENDWGGNLELWSGDWENDKPYLKKAEKSIYPRFNRAVIFSTSDQSFHGHPNQLNCPLGYARKSIALYYLSEPQEGIRKRTRAQFIARPGIDSEDEASNQFRIDRSKEPGKY